VNRCPAGDMGLRHASFVVCGPSSLTSLSLSGEWLHYGHTRGEGVVKEGRPCGDVGMYIKASKAL